MQERNHSKEESNIRNGCLISRLKQCVFLYHKGRVFERNESMLLDEAYLSTVLETKFGEHVAKEVQS